MTYKVLYGVLNWGLGHATRSSQIIETLLDLNFEVVIASDKEALNLLEKEFPKLKFYNITSYNITYPSKSAFYNIVFNSFSILKAINLEKKDVKKIIEKENPDIIISDNRYGFRYSSLKSILITHQLNLLHSNPILKFMGNIINHYFINKFDEIWIPDTGDSNNLTGELSDAKKLKINYQYIGILSRLKKNTRVKKYDISIILSGPEPQRSIFEKIIMKQVKNSKLKIMIIRGVMSDNVTNEEKNVTIKGYALNDEINDIICQSRLMISRSGYSSVMDYYVVGVNALLVPTPGQTEQEYLAKYLSEKQLFYSVEQRNFDLNQLEKINYKSENIGYQNNQLLEVIKKSLK